MRKKYRFLLKSGSNYYVLVNGSVTTTTTATPFIADPVEWQSVVLSYSRNVKYHGLTFKYAVPVSLVEDAAKILRFITLTQYAFESDCTFIAERINDTDDNYTLFYQCEVDFSAFHDSELYVQTELLELGLYTQIKAKENTSYEILIDPADAVSSIHDGIGLKAGYVYGTVAQDIPAYGSTQLKGFDALGIAKDGDYSVGEQKTQTFISMGAHAGPSWATNSAEHNNYIYKVDEFLTGGVDASIRLSHEILYDCPAGSSLSYWLEVRVYKSPSTSAAPTLVTTIYNDNGFKLPPGSGQRRVFLNATYTIGHLDPGDRLYYVFFINGPNTDAAGTNSSHVTFFGNQSIEILMDFRKDPTKDIGYRYGTVFHKLGTKMFAGAYPVKSDFFSNPSLEINDAKPYNLILTPGDALRGLPNAKIKTSLIDFFNDASYRWMLGLGVEKIGGVSTLRLEHLSHFYDNNSITLALENPVIGFGWTWDLERIYGSLKIGNGNFDYDSLNGKDEPNTTTEYKLPVNRKQDTLEMITPYRADMYGIEQVRINLSNKKTTDANSDNDIFVTEVGDAPGSATINGVAVSGYLPRRKQTLAGNSASGILSPTYAYNLGLTPARNLRRNGSLLHSAVFKQEGKNITWQTNDKNQALISNLGSGTVIENAPIPVASLAPALWLPIIYQFETPAPANLTELVEGNPYGRIEFPYYRKGETVMLAGFIDEVSIKPGENETCQWRLIATPDTDLSKLIY